jgi:murein DD-endopeptidase MepM/ murein hydrolase activator NlpD
MRNYKSKAARRPRWGDGGYLQCVWRLPRLLLVFVGVGCAGLAMGLMPTPRPAGGDNEQVKDATRVTEAAAYSARVTLPIEFPETPPNALPDLLPETVAPIPPRYSGSVAPDVEDAALRPRPSTDIKRHSLTIAKGDSLSSIFSALGLSQAELHRILEAGEETAALSRLYEGQSLELKVDSEKHVRELTLAVDATHSWHIVDTQDGFRIRRVDAKLDHRIATATGTISSSLFLSAKEAGLSDTLTMEMAEILAWDVDFALDIRDGDRFTVIYEEIYKKGEKLGDGSILAVDFTNRGRRVRAIRYTDSEGYTDYYTPEGRSLRKAFLRTPVKFSRISSRFTRRRWHPVLHRFRAHRGVDYAAPTGTPVKATGDGRVTFVGRHGGYGRSVTLQHGEKYTTLYAHLSRFAKGLKRNKRVLQGDIIGYVGKSGLASGPHLHYEFRVNGVHRDPLKVALPKASPIAPKHRADFLAHAQSFLTQLDLLARVAVARKDD